MSPLSTEVPEPTTVALGQEDKSFPCCCVSPLSRNPPLLPSPGKHLPSSLRRDLPRLGLCQDIQDAILGNTCSQQRSPAWVYTNQQSAGTSTISPERSCLPGSEVSQPAGEAAPSSWQLPDRSASLRPHRFCWESPNLSQHNLFGDPPLVLWSCGTVSTYRGNWHLWKKCFLWSVLVDSTYTSATVEWLVCEPSFP